MKKLLLVVLLIVCLLCLSTSVFAGSGSAVISHYQASGTWDTYYLHISNITSSIINVKVTLYKSDGTIASGSNLSIGSNPGVTNWNSNLSDASVSFSLNGNCTAEIGVNFTPYNTGYGVIEWTQDSKNTKGLVAYGRVLGSSAYYYLTYSIPINEGQPF